MAKPHIADPDTHETFHFAANCVKHAANLPIDSLTQDHAQTSWCERVQTRPLIVTRPAAINSSQYRLEPTPAAARKRLRRMPANVEKSKRYIVKKERRNPPILTL